MKSSTWRTASLLMLSGLFYGLAISRLSERDVAAHVLENAVTVGFIVFNCWLGVLYISICRKNGAGVRALLAGCLAAPVGILLGTTLTGGTERLFWVADSIQAHQPSAEHILALLRGDLYASASAVRSVLKPGVLTHAWVALWYVLFGSSAGACVVAMLALKALLVPLLATAGMELYTWLGVREPQRGRLAPLFYAFVPTVLFHTMAFYKEAMVHLLVAATLVGILKWINHQNRTAILWALLAVSGLLFERFYVAVTFLPLLALGVGLAFKRRQLFSALVLSIAIFGFIFLLYSDAVSPIELIEYINQQREFHASFKDISFKYNYEIPYIVALFKALATPIWSPDKMTVFTGAGGLFAWGSFVHQFMALAYLMAIAHLAARRELLRPFLFQMPFLFFLVFAAYISPWAGRVRDSYYPLMILFSTLYFTEYIHGDYAWLRTKLRWPGISSKRTRD